MLIGLRIKELRVKKGLTQEELAKKINVTKSTISNYENNTRIPTVSNLHLLADSLGVSFDYLMGNDGYSVTDSNSSDGMFLCKEEFIFIQEIRRYTRVYNKLIESPQRFARSINQNL